MLVERGKEHDIPHTLCQSPCKEIHLTQPAEGSGFSSKNIESHFTDINDKDNVFSLASTTRIPSDWKLVNIVLIFKCKKEDPRNYRVCCLGSLRTYQGSLRLHKVKEDRRDYSGGISRQTCSPDIKNGSEIECNSYEGFPGTNSLKDNALGLIQI
ncbi:hypothetical protein WISP_57511 [Willisornis vidua]|uniref:Uncharacterized protein n=1 Tax=Willisornis vidua TaxID=1566151 RepID=A0ABQ9DHN2_9PASS|nr:hypothetical protein WISP_57511 [Willisornis vidua]